MKLAEESSSSSKANDEVPIIVADLINVANTTVTPIAFLAPRTTRPAERGIIITKPVAEKPTFLEVPKGKGKNKEKRSLCCSFQIFHSPSYQKSRKGDRRK